MALRALANRIIRGVKMGRLTQCKLCNCKEIKKVNSMLKEGVPYKIIANFLKERKIEISTTSIGRHNTNHVKGQRKDRQINRGKIKKAKAKATIVVSRQQSKGDTSVQTLVDMNKHLSSNSLKIRNKYINKLHELQKDFDVIKEMMETVNIARDRRDRAIQEEIENDMLLNTTAQAIKDYGKLIKDFNEIMMGSESIQQLRFAQLVNMITMMFMKRTLSDQTRHQLLQLSEANPIIGGV